MNLLMARNGVNRIDEIPILDGLACTFKMTELMVDLQSATGIRHSREGWSNSSPGKNRVAEVMSFYGIDHLKF